MTGFHLVDGKERVVVLEGLEGGAMTVIKVWNCSDTAIEVNECILYMHQ